MGNREDLMLNEVGGICCPHDDCDARPHIRMLSFGRPPTGHGPPVNDLNIHFECEAGHEWKLQLPDRDGGMIPGVYKVYNEKPKNGKI